MFNLFEEILRLKAKVLKGRRRFSFPGIRKSSGVLNSLVAEGILRRLMPGTRRLKS